MHKLAFALAALLAALVAIPMAATWSANSATTNTSSRCNVIAGSAAIGGANVLTAAQQGVARTIWLRANAHPDQIPPNLADQAATIAIAVASQESSLGANPASRTPNTDGDAGIFQQRTLPGWYGTVAQVNDPTYSADTFLLGHTVTADQYTAARQAGTRPAGPVGYHLPGLVDVPNWSRLDLVDAAEAVQRSADPGAVADDIPLARRLVADFDSTDQAATAADIDVTGSQGCGGATACPPTGLSAETGLQPDTLLVLRCVHQHFDKIATFYGVRPDPLPDHPSGLAVDIMISSAFPDYNSPAAVAYGHAIAAWLQAHHTELGVHYLIYRQHIWNVQRADEGWRPMPNRGSPTANHMDHVHVTTYGHAAAGFTSAAANTGVDQAVTPVEHYAITARFGQIGPWALYHTGLDFAAPIGTPVRAALTGVVTHAGYGPAAPWAGDYVTIRHAHGTSTLYAHMERHDVQVGQTVTTGQQIGAIGVTGRSFGPHLHFEVYPKGVKAGDVYRAVDPLKWLVARGLSKDNAAH